MKKAILIGWLMLWAATATAATALPDAELHRLAAYLSYVVVGVEAQGPGGGSLYTVGANCPECNGVGKVGDGVTMLTCKWEDGLYYCNKGKVAKRSDGDAMDYEDIGEAMCDTVCDCGNCDGKCGGGCCDNCICDTCKATPLPPEVETPLLCPNCPDCPTCSDPKPEENQEPEPTPEREEVACLVDLSQTTWNWQGTSNVPISTMREHLTNEHSIDPASLDKMSREELIALHNLLHNEEVRATAPKAKASSGSGCPGGNCPTSGSSRSRGFGFFRR